MVIWAEGGSRLRARRFRVPLGGKHMKPVARTAMFVFTLVALVHAHRLIVGWEVIANGVIMPMWTSVAGMLIAGGLAFLLWRESRGPNR